MTERDCRDIPEVAKAIEDMNTLDIVERIISETFLQRVAEHAYGKYLAPKVRPYCACSTVATMADQCNVRIKYCEFDQEF